MLEFISFLILFASLVIIICLLTFLYGNRLIEPIFNKLNLRFCTLLTLSLNCFTWFCINWSDKILKVLLRRPFASEAFLCLTAFLLGLSLPINVCYSEKYMKMYGDHAKTRKGKLKLITITVGPIIASMITSHTLNCLGLGILSYIITWINDIYQNGLLWVIARGWGTAAIICALYQIIKSGVIKTSRGDYGS